MRNSRTALLLVGLLLLPVLASAATIEFHPDFSIGPDTRLQDEDTGNFSSSFHSESSGDGLVLVQDHDGGGLVTTTDADPALHPTPEPGTLLLLGSGLVAAGLRVRRLGQK